MFRVCERSSPSSRTCVGCGLSLYCNPILVPLRGTADINAADESAVRLLCQNIIQTCLSLATVGALERIGHATFGDAKESVQKSELVVFCETQQSSSLPFSLSLSRPYAPNTLPSVFLPPSPLFPALAFASVKTKTYSRAGSDATVQFRAAMYLAFCLSGAPSVGA